jgi:hypothetical protein
MKLDADEKELLESVERGEWKSARGRQTRTNTLRSLRGGDVPGSTISEDRTGTGRVAAHDCVASAGHVASGRFISTRPTPRIRPNRKDG